MIILSKEQIIRMHQQLIDETGGKPVMGDKYMIIIILINIVLALVLSLLFKSLSFGTFMIILGIITCYFAIPSSSGRNGMMSYGSSTRDVSPFGQGMMTQMLHLGNKHAVDSYPKTFLLAGIITIAIGVVLQIYIKLW